MSLTPDDIASFPWLDPNNYHTRCTDSICRLVAGDILMGATWQSACKKYGVRHRALQWMRWGYEAATRDADGSDSHAMYLNWYLKISQALGFVEVAAQHRIFRDSPQWWLTNNPESAADWTGGQSITEPDATVVDSGAQTATTAIAPVTFEPTKIRAVLDMLIEAGAAIPEQIANQVVDSDPASGQDGTGTHG